MRLLQKIKSYRKQTHRGYCNIFSVVFKRLRCSHEYFYKGHCTVYSDLWGYDHTKMYFRCLKCGKRRQIRTRHPEVLLDYFYD